VDATTTPTQARSHPSQSISRRERQRLANSFRSWHERDGAARRLRFSPGYIIPNHRRTLQGDAVPHPTRNYNHLHYVSQRSDPMPIAIDPSSTKTKKKLPRSRQTAILKALADPTRFQLLEKIAKARCPLGCADALASLAIAPATLSHHIKELETAGLIHSRRQGKFIYLSINPEVWSSLLASLAALAPAYCGPDSTAAR